MKRATTETSRPSRFAFAARLKRGIGPVRPRVATSATSGTPLSEWVALYASSVVGTLALVSACIVIVWPGNWPLSVWEVVAALAASAVVALVAGLLTIAISWETSQHFGRLSTSEMAVQLQDSLASTLGSAQEFLRAATSMLDYASGVADSLVVMALPDDDILGASSEGREVAIAVRRRFEEDRPTALALATPGLPVGSIWNELALAARDDAGFRQRFTTRRSLVFAIPTISDALIVVLVPSRGKDPLRLSKSAFAFRASTPGTREYAGIRSEVDPGFGNMVLERFCALAQEPRSPYSGDVISASDIVKGHFTGLSITRSIITSQLIQAAYTVQRLEETDDFVIQTLSPSDPAKTIQFFYSSDYFCPPLYAGTDHSGSVVADMLRGGKISVSGLTVWEVGCGPGYVTLQLADKVGPEGKVIATDIDQNAARVASKNVTHQRLSSRVQFVEGDCSDFDLESSGDGSSRSVLVAPNGDRYPIDMVFIELPLLPFRGNRSLSAVERGYLERVPEQHEHLLPDTIVGLLREISEVQSEGFKVVLAVAARDEDRDPVVREIKSLLGERWAVAPILAAEGGFITPLLLTCGRELVT